MLQTGKPIAIQAIKAAFVRAAEMDGRSSDDITNELATDIIEAVVALIMSGVVQTTVSTTGTAVAQVGTGTGKVS